MNSFYKRTYIVFGILMAIIPLVFYYLYINIVDYKYSINPIPIRLFLFGALVIIEGYAISCLQMIKRNEKLDKEYRMKEKF